jgi:hypothetical protein
VDEGMDKDDPNGLSNLSLAFPANFVPTSKQEAMQACIPAHGNLSIP